MWRYFTHNNTRRYVGILPKILEADNYSKHSATKMIPAAVIVYNVTKARENLQQRYDNHAPGDPNTMLVISSVSVE